MPPKRYTKKGRAWTKTLTGKKAAFMRKKNFNKNYKRPLAMQQHNFVERVKPALISLNSGTLAADGTLLGTRTFEFALSQISQAAHYQALFEYYRIDKVVLTFKYKGAGIHAYQTTGTNPQLGDTNPTIYFKVDHNDIIAQTFADLLQSMRTKEKQLSSDNPNFTISLKPAILTEAFKSVNPASQTTYMPKWGQWITTGDPSVPHYGLKVQVQCPNPLVTVDYGSLQLEYKIYFSCKNNE